MKNSISSVKLDNGTLFTSTVRRVIEDDEYHISDLTTTYNNNNKNEIEISNISLSLGEDNLFSKRNISTKRALEDMLMLKCKHNSNIDEYCEDKDINNNNNINNGCACSKGKHNMKIKSQNDNNNNNIITNDKPIVLCKRVFEKTQDKKELNLISKMIHNNTNNTNKHSNHKLSQLTLNSKKHFYDLNTKTNKIKLPTHNNKNNNSQSPLTSKHNVNYKNDKANQTNTLMQINTNLFNKISKRSRNNLERAFNSNLFNANTNIMTTQQLSTIKRNNNFIGTQTFDVTSFKNTFNFNSNNNIAINSNYQPVHTDISPQKVMVVHKTSKSTINILKTLNHLDNNNNNNSKKQLLLNSKKRNDNSSNNKHHIDLMRKAMYFKKYNKIQAIELMKKINHNNSSHKKHSHSNNKPHNKLIKGSSINLCKYIHQQQQSIQNEQYQSISGCNSKSNNKIRNYCYSPLKINNINSLNKLTTSKSKSKSKPKHKKH